MSARGRYNLLNTEMYTLFVESKLAAPSFENVIIEVNPREKISSIVNNYLRVIQNNAQFLGLVIYDDQNCKLDLNATIESQAITEGSKLFIGYDGSNLHKPMHIAIIGISTIIIAFALLIVSALLFGATGGTVPFDYGIVIDAGSTHTEIFLYQWSGDKIRGTGNVHQKSSCEYEIGIDRGEDPVNILSCVNNVSSLVPKGTTPSLYLGATAGMRLLNITSPKEANIILTSLKYALSLSSVKVKTLNILQGQKEALFSWITTNFLTQSLQRPEVEETCGALDLGGASTQYAFSIHNDSLHDNNTSILKLYGHEYFVNSASFICFGHLEAENRHFAMLFMNNQSTSVNDACLPNGYMEKLDSNSFSQKPCIRNDKFNKWLQNNSIFGELTIKGASDYYQCRKNVINLVDMQTCEVSGFKHCLPSIDLRSLNMTFKAFSTYYYVVHFFNGSNSLDQFINSTRNWCSLSWIEIQHTQPKTELKHVLRYCFAATYIIELITRKYGFDSYTWNNIDFIKEIKNADVGWTLGYIINATNAIPAELPTSSAISFTIFVLLLILCVFMIIIAVIINYKYVYNRLDNSHSKLIES